MPLLLTRPLYPFFLGIYFVLFVYAENLGDVSLDMLPKPLLTVLLLSAIFFVILRVLSGSYRIAAPITASLLVLIFLPPSLGELIRGYYRIDTYVVFLLVLVVTAIFCVSAMRRPGRDITRNRLLNVVAGVLVVVSLLQITIYEFGALKNTNGNDTKAFSALDLPELDAPVEKPDVYYILLDAYSRADVLKDYYGHDNSTFIRNLEGYGFDVAGLSSANYHRTFYVTPALLNYDYIDYQSAPGAQHMQAVTHALKAERSDNRVAAIFKAMGYEIFSVRSTGDFLHMSYAQSIMPPRTAAAMNEFDDAVFETTVLSNVYRYFSSDLVREKRDSVNFVFDQLASIAEVESPKLVFAHVMAPHQPFVFDATGKMPLTYPDFGKDEFLAENIAAYSGQVHYINTRVEELVRTILSKPGTPPIIIIQGDHGLRLSAHKNGRLLYDNTNACYRELYANLNAMYLPGERAGEMFHDAVSPVNTFRLVLDSYFGTNLGLLPDRTFFPIFKEGFVAPEFVDVSAEKETCDANWESRFTGLN